MTYVPAEKMVMTEEGLNFSTILLVLFLTLYKPTSSVNAIIRALNQALMIWSFRNAAILVKLQLCPLQLSHQKKG